MRVADASRMFFTRDEAAKHLELPPKVIDALVESGTLALESTSIESFCRETLIRLYKAMASVSLLSGAAAPPPPQMEESEITRSIAEFVEPVLLKPPESKPDLRIAPRYSPRRQIGGKFRGVKFKVLQVSTTGLRVRHDESIMPGDEAKLTFSILRPARVFMLRARVVWTSIAQRGEGPSFCISGLRVIDGFEQLREAIDILRAARELDLDDSLVQKSARASSPPALVGLSDEDVASIIRAYRTFSADPVEANRWYTRARFALADSSVREAAPARARDREEVLGIWEFLDRRVDIRVVTNVLGWIRRTRSTAVA